MQVVRLSPQAHSTPHFCIFNFCGDLFEGISMLMYPYNVYGTAFPLRVPFVVSHSPQCGPLARASICSFASVHILCHNSHLTCRFSSSSNRKTTIKVSVHCWRRHNYRWKKINNKKPKKGLVFLLPRPVSTERNISIIANTIRFSYYTPSK